MKTNINVGNSVSISANVDIENIISSARYAVSFKHYDKANEMLFAAILAGCEDYRIYVTKAMVDLDTDDNKSLFESLEMLRAIECAQNGGGEAREAIDRLMQYRGMNGVTALHNATFHERMDLVQFCVEHGSDVNLIAGMNRVTPVSIMFVPVAKNLSGIDGTPFTRHKAAVKEIRRYLMQHGAVDKWRMGY